MRGLRNWGKLALATIVAVSSIGGGLAAAQSSSNSGGVSGNGFRISPVRSELTVEKGKSGSIAITIENPTDFPTTAKAVVNDFVASDAENGEPRLILDDKAPLPKNDFKSLVGNVPDVKLAPREKKDINVSIYVPANANSGGYYGAIRFVPSSSTNGGNVTLTASVGTIVLVTVPGNLTEKVNLVQLGASQNGKPKSFFTGGNVTSFVRLQNAGDIHTQPFGKVQIKNMFGKVVSDYELNDAKANVLPGSTRKFEKDLSKPGGGWFGRYTIEANLGYAQGSGNLISAKATFWYVPTWALIVLLVLVLLIAVGIYLLVRKFRGTTHRAKR